MARKAEPPGGTKNIKAAKAKTHAALERSDHPVKMPWWSLTDTAAASEANERIAQWLSFDVTRQYDLDYFARLYGSGQLGFAGSIAGRNAGRNVQTGSRNRITNSLAATFNGCLLCCDTMTNTIAQHKPVVQFTSTDGDWSSHKRAKERARFVAGWLHEQDAYTKTAEQFNDSSVWGDGALHIAKRNGRAVLERVFVGDIFIDPASCITNQSPQEIGRIHLIDRHTAWAMYDGNPEAQKKIREAPEASVTVDNYVTSSTDLIQLNEMWRLPTYPGAGDGRHLVATALDVLEMEEYKHPNFPFAFIRCTKRKFGFWAQGLVEQLENLQLQYNELSYTINEAHEIGAGATLFVNSSSNINPDTFDNEIGRYIRGDGPPTSLLWQLVQPEIYERLEKLERQFWIQSGIAQFTNSPDKDDTDPREAAIAIRQKISLNDARHALWFRSYEDSHLMLARILIQTVGDILADARADVAAARAKDPEAKVQEAAYTVYAVNSPTSDPIDFADLGFEEGEQFVITCMPVNDLPDTVEGRIALAQEFVQNGYYDEATARSVFLAPFDTVRVETLFNAAHEFFSKTLDAIVEHNTQPPPPQTIDNLALGFKMALQYYAYAKVRNVSQARIDTLTMYIVALKAKVDEAAAAAPMAPPGGAPLANPEPAPTSPLLPSPNAGPPA